jgi:hypothetical protein
MHRSPVVPGDDGNGQSRWRSPLLLVAAALLAFLLYRPDINAPFEIVDFSETLPILADGDGFLDRFLGLYRYYLGHGRAAIGLSAGLAAKWSIFEWWTPGWQWTRFVVGMTLVALTWRLCRTLGANVFGAAFAGLLFVVAETAAHGWIKPSLNEPFGTVLLIAASLVACRFQGTERPTRLALSIAALLGAMILVKETLVAATFFPIGLAISRNAHGQFTTPARSRRNTTLLLLCGTTIAVTAMAVAWALTQTASDGYARQFGASDSLVSNALFGLLPSILPFPPVSEPPAWFATAADVAWLLLLVSAWRPTTDGVEARNQRWLIVLALGLPIARTLIYLPWPLQFPYYSIPYLLGVAILAAIGVTKLSERRGLPRVLAWVCAIVVVVFAAAHAGAVSSRYFALRRLSDRVVADLYSMRMSGNPDSILIGVPRVKEQAWWGLGPTLARYAAATARPLPPVREVRCSDIASLLAQEPRPGVALVAMRYQCDLTGVSARGPIERAHKVDFSRWTFVTDSLQAQIRPPGP